MSGARDCGSAGSEERVRARTRRLAPALATRAGHRGHLALAPAAQSAAPVAFSLTRRILTETRCGDPIVRIILAATSAAHARPGSRVRWRAYAAASRLKPFRRERPLMRPSTGE